MKRPPSRNRRAKTKGEGKTMTTPAKGKAGRPRKLKSSRALLARLLTQPLPQGAARLGGLEGWVEEARAAGTVPMYEGMLLAQVFRALEGDLKALQFIRETLGEETAEQRAGKEPPAGLLTEGDRALLHKLAARLGVEEP